MSHRYQTSIFYWKKNHWYKERERGEWVGVYFSIITNTTLEVIIDTITTTDMILIQIYTDNDFLNYSTIT